MTIIAILVIMTIIGKIEVFFNVTRMEEKNLLSKICVFSWRKHLRQVHYRQKGEHARGAEMPQQVMEVCIILPFL